MPLLSRARVRTASFALIGLFATAGSPEAAGPKVPEGFEVKLVATVPAVLYPCQVATAPDGTLFVAEDPMDQVGPYEAYNGRILLFRDGKDPVVFADGFRAVQGMAWYDGSLYVSHMPFLTVIRDKDGDGKADEKTTLFKDLGPTNNQGLNDHIVSGIQFGMDGRLYISVGDKGIPLAHGPDGRTITLKGGGVVRCRPDGTELEIVSSGTRNHLEANLNDRDEIFTYDNTDDGLGWWTRVTHHIDGGYYGYAYDYHEFQYRMLPRMAEYGGGSPCGAVIYKEDVWPEKYRNAGFWAEWGKGKVHGFRFEPAGATYKVAEAIDFALPDDTANFRPIDLAVSYDGRTLYVADWNMGGWGSKTEKVGRIWAIRYKEPVDTRPRGSDADPLEAQFAQLDHPSFNERIRAQRAIVRAGKSVLASAVAMLADPKTKPVVARHLVWIIDSLAGGSPEGSMPLIDALKSPVDDVRAQAARALGERAVPLARQALVERLTDASPAVRLQGVIALGRIGDPQAVPGLIPVLADNELYIAFSARQALRRIGDWKAVTANLGTGDPKVRDGILKTLELQYDPDAATTLATYAADLSKPAAERAEALKYLAYVHRKAKPWDGRWWGTRPAEGKGPAKVDEWAGTPIVLGALRAGLTDRDAEVRTAAVTGVRSTNDAGFLPILRERFAQETDPTIRSAIALTLGSMNDKESVGPLSAALRDRSTPEEVRDAALKAVSSLGGDVAVSALLDLLKGDDLPPKRQVRVLEALGRFKAMGALTPLLEKLGAGNTEVRAAAATALGVIGKAEGVTPRLREVLKDGDVKVRRAAITALGALKDKDAVPALVEAAGAVEGTRFEAAMALAKMPDMRALGVYVRGLTDVNQDLRRATATALSTIREPAIPVLESLSERKELAPSTVTELIKIYTGLQPIIDWKVIGPFALDSKPPINPEGSIDLAATMPGLGDKVVGWKTEHPVDTKGQINLNKAFSSSDDAFAYGYAELNSPTERKAQLAVGSDDTLTVWLNGKKVYDYPDRRGFTADQDRVDVTLNSGVNRIVVKCANMGGGWQFAVATTSPAEYAFLKAPAAGAFNPDEFKDFALKTPGDPSKGRALFADLKGLACVKCHAVKGEGGNVGPDLAGVGATYPRGDIVESVLYPSQKIFSGYEPVVVATQDGRVLTGILKNESPDALEIQDAEAKLVSIKKTEIEDRKKSDVSLMPSGLAEGLTKESFADLIAYLTTLKDKPPGK